MPSRTTDTTTRPATRKPRAASVAAAPAANDAAVQAKPRKRAPARARKSETAILTGETLHHFIAEAAYYRAASRGFEGGCALDDWLQAEAEITRTLAAQAS